jgi:hypothetical protein
MNSPMGPSELSFFHSTSQDENSFGYSSLHYKMDANSGSCKTLWSILPPYNLCVCHSQIRLCKQSIGLNTLFLRVTQVCLVKDKTSSAARSSPYTSVISLSCRHTPIHRHIMSRTVFWFVTVLCYKYTHHTICTHIQIYTETCAQRQSHTRIHLILSTNSKSGRERTFRLWTWTERMNITTFDLLLLKS